MQRAQRSEQRGVRAQPAFIPQDALRDCVDDDCAQMALLLELLQPIDNSKHIIFITVGD